jgi:hypothetical protein
MRPNWPILWCAFFWWLIETQFFGWNASPSCVEELFADGLVLVLVTAAFAHPAARIEITLTRTIGDSHDRNIDA